MTTRRTLRSAWVHTLSDRVIDLGQQEVRTADAVHRLSWQEVLVLDYLIAADGQPVGRGELLSLVWGYSADANTRAVDRAIARIRAKIEADSRNPAHLLTLHGVGYRWAAADPSPTEPAPASDAELVQACARSTLVAVVGPRPAALRWLERHRAALSEAFDPVDLQPADPASLEGREPGSRRRTLWTVGCDRRPDALLLARLDRLVQRSPHVHLLLCCPEAPVDGGTHCTWLAVPPDAPPQLGEPSPEDRRALAFLAAFEGGAPADAVGALERSRPALEGVVQRGLDGGWVRAVQSPAGTVYRADADQPLDPELAGVLVDWALGRCALTAPPAGVTRLEQPLLRARDLALEAGRLDDAATLAARLDDVHGRYHVVNASAAVLERAEPWTGPWRSALARAPMPAVQAACDSLDRTPAEAFRWAADSARQADDPTTTVVALQRLAGTRILASAPDDALELYQQALALAEASDDEVCAIDAGVRAFALHTALGRTGGLHRLDELQRRAANLRLWHVVAEMIASRALYDANHGDLARGARALQDALPVMERNGAHHVYFTLATHASLMRQALGRVDGELATLDGLLVEAEERGSWYAGAFVQAARGTLLAQLGEWGMATWAWERARAAGVPMIDSFVAFERAFFARLRGDPPTALPPIRGDEDQHRADFLAASFPEGGPARPPGPPNQYRYHGVRRWAQILVQQRLPASPIR